MTIKPMTIAQSFLLFITLMIFSYSRYVWPMANQRGSQLDDAIQICTNSQTDSQDEQTATVGPETLIIPGDCLKAAIVAAEEFKKFLEKNLKGKSSPVSIHLSDIGNYSITVVKENKGKEYKVDFSPLPFQNSPIKGGAITYFIDSKSFKVLREDRWM